MYDEQGETRTDARPRLRVALGRFPALLERGIVEVLRDDRSVSTVESGLDAATLSRMAALREIEVAVIYEPGIRSSASHELEFRAHRVGLVVLAERPTQSQALRLLGAGASCVSLTTSPDGLRATIHATAEGRSLFLGESDRRLEGQVAARVGTLTEREHEVLRYLAEGRSYDEAALSLGVATNTVRVHSAHIRKKLGVQRKRDLLGITASLIV